MASLSGVPECGLSCLVSELGRSLCASTNQTCLCEDSLYNEFVTNCVQANCTVVEQLTTQNITSTTCGYTQPNQDNTLLAVNVVFFSFQTLFFLLRMLSRALRIERWGHDDTTITLAYILIVGFLGASIIGQRNGLGRDVWAVSPPQITEFLKVVFVFEVLYSTSLALIKMSLCFLYMRLLPGKQFHRVVKVTQVFNVLIMVGFILTDLDQCKPMSYFWTRWDGEHSGWCFNSNAMIWAQAAVNIVLDFWLLALPASQLRALSVPGRKRIGVHIMFGLGIFQTIVSLVRLQSLVTFDRTSNPTMEFFGVGIWSASESTIGIMIACLPAAYQLFKRSHQQGPHPQSPSNTYSTYPMSSGDAGTTLRSSGACCGRDHHHMRPTSRGLGRIRRRHSMSGETMTAGKSYDDSLMSPRSFMTTTHVDDSDTIELASPTRARMLPESPDCSCGRPRPRPGEYLGVSERYMANQDVSVTISNPSGEGTTTLSPEKARYYI